MDNKKQRLSMIRSYTLADLFTLGNASCGTLTIFLCLAFIADEKAAELWTAFILPLVALAFDAPRLHRLRSLRCAGDAPRGAPRE